MTLLFIHATNSRFFSCDEGAKYDRPADALAAGVRGAVALLAEEINQGERSAAIEISIQLEDGTQLLRSVVSVCVSSLLPVVAGLKQRTF